jgi:hypothetical protein
MVLVYVYRLQEANAQARGTLECGENRRFGFLCTQSSKQKSKAAILAALQKAAACIPFLPVAST